LSGMVITLKKSKFDGFGNLLDGLLSKLGNYDSTVQDLKHTVTSIECENDGQVSANLGSAIDAIVDSEESKEDKKEKINALKQKIETFVNNAVQHEKAAADKIKEKKKDFYKNYENLRPNCETTLGSIWEYIKKKAKNAWEWVKENVVALAVAALIVIAAIVVVIVCPASLVAIIAVVVGALSAAMGIADLICIAATGNDIAGLIAGDGSSPLRNILSQIYKGLGWGLDIASVILPIGAIPSAGANAYKTTFKELIRHPFKSLKGLGNNKILKNFGNMLKHPIVSLKGFIVDGAKGIGKGLKGAFYDGFKTGFKDGMKNLGKTGLKGIVSFTGLDKMNDARKVIFGVGGGARSDIAMKCLGFEDFVLKGSSTDKYNTILNDNKDALTAATGGAGVGEAFGQVKVQLDTTPSGAADVKDAFFNSVKSNDELANQLMQTADLNINDFQSPDKLSRALEKNGFSINSSPAAGGGSNLAIVPQWTDKVLATDASGALNVLHPGDALAGGRTVNRDFRGEVIKQYEKYMSTQNTINAYQDLASNIYKKNMEYKFFEFGADQMYDGKGMQNIDKTVVKGFFSPAF